MTQQLAVWRGSEKTAEQVREEIARRYGEEEAENYDPQTNCFTLPTWNKLGFRVRKGEKAIRSVTLIEKIDPTAEEGEQEEVRKYPKTVYLFYIKQVEKKQ
jgi:N-terminal domain of anti-restriction factor ArdC